MTYIFINQKGFYKCLLSASPRLNRAAAICLEGIIPFGFRVNLPFGIEYSTFRGVL